VQGHGDLAAIDPGTLGDPRRLRAPSCRGGHGLALDPATRLAFAACADNSTLLTVDLDSRQVTGTSGVVEHPMSSPMTKARNAFTSPPKAAPAQSSTNRTSTSPP
jgi:DNA-binding beta-propeller fold protein YncE